MNGDAVPSFDEAFRERLHALFRWRRDVRRFRSDPLAPAVVDDLLGTAALAPSVGLSQPWRFVVVGDPGRRRAIIENFRACNDDALRGYDGERARRYATLKLSGLEEAPVHVAAFVDRNPDAGHGLGRRTMPETLAYSVVAAVHTLWLDARSRGIGVGWVSILDPGRVVRDLDVSAAWSLVAYLCIGYPERADDTPELQRAGWEQRDTAASFVTYR